MTHIKFLAAFSLIFAPSALFAEEALPRDIFIKNLSRGFSYENLYALKDGKIWTRPNTRNTGVEGEWHLFDGTGIPSGKDAASFTKDDPVAEFSTEATMVVAASAKGQLYFWQPTLEEKTAWAEKTGAPIEDRLSLPKHRTWCFSMSVMRAPWKRLTPMHEKDIVSYWEDADGNRTEFGFTATVYSVDPDGQRIRYTDTGLPTSWHKAFTSPERGRFIIEKISASASTLFVTDLTGHMYTRMMDYEMEGGCPGLTFLYEHGKRTHGDEVAPLMKSRRTLPLPDWRKQEAVEEVLNDETHTAAVTRNITILLTGKGNAARELRIQGRNRSGEYGYWKKAIYAPSWEFVRTDERFDDSEIIREYLAPCHQGAPLDRDYKGSLKKRGEKDLEVELLGFYYYSTPSILRVHCGGKQFDLTFHTVDMWSPTVQKKDYPELIGNPAGEPKLLQGTIEIPDELLSSQDPDIRNVIDSRFRDFNRSPFAFTVAADDGKVIIASRRIQSDIRNDRHFAIRKRLTMELVSERSATGVHAEMFYTSIANHPFLEIPAELSAFRNEDLPKIDELIVRNEKALKEIKGLLSNFRKEHRKAQGIAALGSAVYYIFDGLVNLIGLTYWNDLSDDPGTSENVTQLAGVAHTGGTPMNEYALMNLELSSRKPDDYNRAVKVLKDRIKLLKELRKKAAGKKNRGVHE